MVINGIVVLMVINVFFFGGVFVGVFFPWIQLVTCDEATDFVNPGWYSPKSQNLILFDGTPSNEKQPCLRALLIQG